VSGFSRTAGKLLFHRDARNTFDPSIVSASTIGLIAS
jgi:hypothetical protein